METRPISLLPTRSFVFIIICAVIILGFLSLYIYPSYNSARDLDAAIDRAFLQIEEQKALAPVYSQLREILEKSKTADAVDLPAGEGGDSPARDAGQIQVLIRDIARESGLAAESIEADIATIIEDAGRIKMNVTVSGDYADFRKFMFLLNDRLPSIEYTERLQIQRMARSKAHRLALVMWLVQD